MNPLPSRRARPARWLPRSHPFTRALCCAATLLCLLTPPAQAQPTPEPASAQPAGESPAETAATEPRFDVEVQAPGALQAFLLRHMELMRYRTLADLEAPELERLMARSRDNLLDLLGTQGHFSPTIRIEGPLAQGKTPLGSVRVEVEPGPATRIANADVFFRGDIASNPESAEQRESVRRVMTRRVGEAFTQADWSDAKTQVLRELTARRYPTGRIFNSLADVDTGDHSVRLAIEVDSGVPLRLGAPQIEGAERYDPAVVKRLLQLSGVTPGSDFDIEKLQNAQQRLADTGYFEAAHVSVEPVEGQSTAPVRVQLREARRQKLVLGVGGSTDSGARVSIEHTHHRVPGIGWQAVSKLQLERDDRLASTEWRAPPDAQGWQWITSALAARQVDGNDTTTSQRLRLGQAQRSDALDRSFFLQYDRSDSVNAVDASLSEGTEAAMTANYGWTRRHFDNMPFPQSGWGLGVELGAGYTLIGERRPFARTVARWRGYLPLGDIERAKDVKNDKGTPRWGRLALRLEGGAVWAKTDTPVPKTQRFLTGGDATVRGYGLRDIGVPQSDGGVSPGRYMAVGSVEWQIPIWRDGQRTPWEAALFVDGGSVADQVPDLKPYWGVGAGVRYNSPVGPLNLDLAYGVKTREWRLHFNVGFSF